MDVWREVRFRLISDDEESELIIELNLVIIKLDESLTFYLLYFFVEDRG